MNALSTNRPSNAPWNKLQRAASELKETPEQLLHVDGVRWDIENLPNGKTTDNGVFSDAYINPAKVKDVFLVVKPFTEKPGNLPGHALLGFEFQPDAPVTNSQGQKDSGLVLSVEFRYREGEEFDPVTSIEDPHPIIYQLGTWSDAIEKATIHDANPMQKYKLKLNDEQKASLLKERLAAAAADHSADMYHPVTNSCLSTLIDGVNKVVPEKQRIPHNAPDGTPDVAATVPIWCSSTFRSHGLLAQMAPTVIPANPK